MKMSHTKIDSSVISLEKIVERIFAFRQITPIDRDLIKSALLSKDNFSYHDNSQLNRVYEGIKSGAIWVTE